MMPKDLYQCCFCFVVSGKIQSNLGAFPMESFGSWLVVGCFDHVLESYVEFGGLARMYFDMGCAQIRRAELDHWFYC
jgi:hypothetical protein